MILHRIKVPIGDWSDDGHGKCDYFVIESNKSLNELIDLHFLATEKLGFDPGDICGEYEESTLTQDIIDKFQEIDIGQYMCKKPEGFDATGPTWEDYPQDTKDVLILWMACLRYASDNAFEYSIEDEEKLPILYNWSVDHTKYKDKYLSTPGYGMFY